MPSDRRRGSEFAYLLVAYVLSLAVIFIGCDDHVPDDDDVLGDARRRVAENILPDLSQESEDVLRNLTNLLAALPQICATPMATLGSFTSSLPALGKPRSVVFIGEDDEDRDEQIFAGSWRMVWRDVLLGSDGTSTTESDAARVDITLNVRQRSLQQSTLQVVPFTLVPQSALLATATGGQPAFLDDRAAFYLYQDETTGVWILRWRTPESAMVFEGTLSGAIFSRVIRRVSDLSADIVESLEMETAASTVRFEEMTAPGDDKGFAFFVRPGELPRFELRIGDTEDDLSSITRDQLRIGRSGARLPPRKDPDDFELATNIPFLPTGAPAFLAGAELGTFIWQDIDQNTCNAGEDQWRVRFSTDGEQKEFSGDVTALEDDESAELTFRTIGPCQGDRTDGGRTLDYTCTLEGDRVGGYDICVTAGRRVRFIPAVDDLPDPGLVFIGAERQPPPSPDPASIIFDIDLQERQSSRDLDLEDAQVVLSGNSNLDGVLRLNPDQISLDPLCGRLPEEIEAIVRPQVVSTFAPGELLVQPRVRFSGGGDYSTSRFDGSSYELEEVEFLTPAVDTLDDVRRFPDRGQIVLRTRVKDEAENTIITAENEGIQEDANGRVTVPVEYEISISLVIFELGFNKDECGELQEVLGFNPCEVALTIVE